MPILQLSHCPFLLPRAGPSLPLAPPASGSLYTWSVSSTRWGLPEGHRGNEVTDPEPQLAFCPHCPALHNGWFPSRADGETGRPRGKARSPRSHNQQGLDLNSGL